MQLTGIIVSGSTGPLNPTAQEDWEEERQGPTWHNGQWEVAGCRPHCAVAVRANVSMGCTKTTTGPEQEPWKDPLNSTHLGSSSPEARHSPWMVYLRGAQRLRINAAGRGGKEGLCFQPGEEKARRPAGGNCQTPKVQHMGR